MGSIYKRGNVYWIAYVRDGQQFCESARDTQKGIKGNHSDAVRLLQLREGDVAKGLPVSPEIGRLPFSDALDDVVRNEEANERRAVESTKRRIRLHLKPFFGTRRISDVTTITVRAYVASRKQEGATAATINRELAIIRRAFRLAHRGGSVMTIPHIEFLDESRNVRQGFLEPDEFENVRDALTPAVYADVAETAYITGWRLPSEVLTLTWPQVHSAAKLLRIEPGTTKGGEGRQFPITTKLATILKRRKRKKHDACALVFHETGQPIHRRKFHKQWTEACEAAGLKGRIPHDMRRSAVRNLERLAVPRKVAMQMVGHKTESIYRRYHIVAESDIHAAGARLDTMGSVPTNRRRHTERKTHKLANNPSARKAGVRKNAPRAAGR